MLDAYSRGDIDDRTCRLKRQEITVSGERCGVYAKWGNCGAIQLIIHRLVAMGKTRRRMGGEERGREREGKRPGRYGISSMLDARCSMLQQVYWHAGASINNDDDASASLCIKGKECLLPFKRDGDTSIDHAWTCDAMLPHRAGQQRKFGKKGGKTRVVNIPQCISDGLVPDQCELAISPTCFKIVLHCHVSASLYSLRTRYCCCVQGDDLRIKSSTNVSYKRFSKGGYNTVSMAFRPSSYTTTMEERTP